MGVMSRCYRSFASEQRLERLGQLDTNRILVDQYLDEERLIEEPTHL
ncbi:hypothetical protein ACFT1A_28485 [Rhodococcus sp. NPDC057135]